MLHQIGHGRVTRVDTINVEETSMKLNGRQVFSILHCRDAEQTDNEFAEAEGFEDFMSMADFLAERYGLPFEGFVIHWELR